jgi:nicotinamide-nucleotide adenylyltransferase
VDILVPKYNVVFTNDILTALLFKQREIEVVEPSLYRRKELSATEVRSRMAKDEDWKELVTIQTAKVVEDIHGIERIKAIIAKHTA